MRIIDKLMSSLGYAKAKDRLLTFDSGSSYGGLLGQSSQQNYRNYLQQYADVSWVYACVFRIASKGAGVPMRFYRKVKKGGKIVYDEVTDHPIINLLETVNPFMSGVDLKEATFSYSELTGNAYWLLDMFVNGKPTEIYPLNPQRVKIVPHPKDLISHYTYNVGGAKKEIKLDKNMVIHFKYFNPMSDYYGLSPISAGKLAIDTQSYGDQYNRNFFLNSAEPKGALISEENLSDDQKKRIAAGWRAMHQGVQNAHKTVIFEKGLKWEAIGLSQRDMDFINSKKMTREDILGVFGVPPAMVGVFEYANYANSKEQRRIFWQDTMIPKLKKLEAVINSFLIMPYDENLVMEFDLSEVEALKEDEKSKAEVNGILTKNGIRTINEVREEMGLKKVDWGDTWNAPMNLIPISSPRSEPASPEPIEEEAVDEIIAKDAGLKPYPNEHSCRLESPDKYDRFARKNCAVKVDDKCIDFIYGVKEGKSELQAMRYKTDIWSESAAKNHCKSKDGMFEPAEKEYKNQEDDEKTREKIINDKIWEYFKRSTEGWERKFKPILREEFTLQEREVIRNLRDYGLKAYSASVLSAKKENQNQRIDMIIFNDKEAGKRLRKKSKPVISGSLSEQAKREIERMGLGIEFDINNPAVVEWIDKKIFEFSFEVNKTTREVLRKQLKDAIAEGESIADVEKRIENVFNMARGYRTERIARTEIISSTNNGSFQAYKQSEVVEKKTWISTRDGDVRPSHQIDGEEVGLDDTFSNGLIYPGDPSGDVSEVVNCRCTFKGVVKR